MSWGTVTVSEGSFAPGTVVSLVERTPAYREDWQVTFTPNPRQPVVRENMPPSELPVRATATADVQGQVAFPSVRCRLRTRCSSGRSAGTSWRADGSGSPSRTRRRTGETSALGRRMRAWAPPHPASSR
jgi:hypothetical protein